MGCLRVVTLIAGFILLLPGACFVAFGGGALGGGVEPGAVAIGVVILLVAALLVWTGTSGSDSSPRD